MGQLKYIIERFVVVMVLMVGASGCDLFSLIDFNFAVDGTTPPHRSP
jgi:hypothetical protein